VSLESQKLPPLPYPQMPGNDYTAEDMRKYAQAAVLAERKACDIESLQVDAERYRRWRSDYVGADITVMLRAIEDAWTEDEVDSAIDAAIRARKEATP